MSTESKSRKDKKPFSLSSKLLFFFGIMYFSSALSYTIFFYYSAKTSLVHSLDGQLEQTLKSIVTVIQTSIDTAVKNYLRFDVEHNYGVIAGRMEKAVLSEDELTEIMISLDSQSQIDNYIIDKSGLLIYPSGRWRKGDSIWSERDAEAAYYIQGLISKASALPEGMVDAVKHQNDEGVVISVFTHISGMGWILVSSINRNKLKSFIDVDDFRDDIISMKPGENGSVEIFDEKGLQIVHSAKQFEGNIRETETHDLIYEIQTGSIERVERLAEVSSLQYVTTSSESQKNEMIRKTYKFAHIPDMQWFIAVAADRDEVFKPLNRLRNLSVITYFMFLFVFIGISRLVMEKAILKNLRIMTRAFGDFKKMKLSTRVAIQSNDELETLSNSFNSMADTIQNHTLYMEKMIDERTAELLQSEKMAALGGLVAGIAHEINTPVGIAVTASTHIKSELVNMRKRFESNTLKKSEMEEFLQLVDEAVKIIYTSINNAGALIERFKTIAVDQSVKEVRRFNFREYLGDVILSLKSELKNRKMDTIIDCADNLEIVSDPGYFYQIFYNLILNSLKHGFDPEEPGVLTFRVYTQSDDFIIEYSDNGRGIPEASLPHIFEPFFTTKRGAGGTGLGLHIIYNLVTQALGGKIKCSNSNGALFRIVIPENLLS